MVYIYVLKLEKGKYYVGKTNNPYFRLESHFNSNGSAWTQKYKPIKILKIIDNCDDYDEDKYTRKYMDKYGIENVRGGSFVSVKLENSTIEHLKQMSNGTNNNCFICGKNGHFAKDCQEECEVFETDDDSDDGEYEEVWCCSYCNKEFTTKKGVTFHENVFCNKSKQKYKKYVEENDEEEEDNCCFRCGRTGHYVSSCYASTHINGYRIN